VVSFILIISRTSQNVLEVIKKLPGNIKDEEYFWSKIKLSDQAIFYYRGILSFKSSLPTGKIIVMGDLYKEFNKELRECSEEDLNYILQSGGQHLIQHYWGNYISIIHNTSTNQLTILRAPVGACSCFYFIDSEKIIVFSSLQDVQQFLPKELSLNENFIIKALCYHRVITEETGLNNIKILSSGQALIIRDTEYTTRWFWDPLKYCSTPYRDNFSKAKDEIRQTVLRSLQFQAQKYKKILLYFSGGLDSNIVAASLKRSANAPEIIGFNYKVTRSSASDERVYAESCARELNIPLILEEIDPFDTDILQEEDYILSPIPSPQYIGSSLWKKAQKIAIQHSCDVIWDGDGGDQLFYAFRTSHILNDYISLKGFTFEIFKKIKETAELCNNSIFPILQDVWAARGERGIQSIYQPLLNRKNSFLNFDLKDYISLNDIIPPILQGKDVPLGKIKQILGILNLQLNTVPLGECTISTVHPFGNQPLVEACLSIPSYILTEGGVSRGLIREAMKGIIPEIARRRFTKGTTSRFVNKWFGNHKLHQYLLEGYLVQLGYINSKKLEEIFNAPSNYNTQHQVIDIISIEIWLRKILTWKLRRIEGNL